MQTTPTASSSSDSQLRPRGVPTTQVGPLTIDPLSREVRVDGDLLKLTNKEYGVLRVLASNPTRVFTREQLYGAVWGYSQMRSRTLDTVTARLRSKLVMAGVLNMVISVWGVGYRLVEYVDSQEPDASCCPVCGGAMPAGAP